MPKQIKDQNGQTLLLEDAPFGTGGEGDVYNYFNPTQQQRHSVVKLYHNLQEAQKRQTKLEYMVKNPPPDPQQPEPCIIWPTELVYSMNMELMGYVMPLVRGGIDLEALCTDSKLELTCGPQWKRFNYSENGSFCLRLRLSQNMAAAIEALHSTGRYVLVDLKPVNVKIKPNGLMSMIDMDSIQIVENGKKLFSAKVYTEEYAPPECHNQKLDYSRDIVPPSWDHFSYSVMIYRLLFALHPFAGSYKNTSILTLAEAIQHGYFANGRNAGSFHRIPPPHKSFSILPKDIQDLFVRSFDDGHHTPSRRPEMTEWYASLDGALQSKTINNATIAANLPKPPVRKTANPYTVGAGTGGGGFHRPWQNVHQPNYRRNFFTGTYTDITLQALNSTVVIGKQVTLSWNIRRVNQVFITKVGYVQSRGNATVSVFRDTVFDLTADDGNGKTISKHVTVAVPLHNLANHPPLHSGMVKLIIPKIHLSKPGFLARYGKPIQKSPLLDSGGGNLKANSITLDKCNIELGKHMPLNSMHTRQKR